MSNATLFQNVICIVDELIISLSRRSIINAYIQIFSAKLNIDSQLFFLVLAESVASGAQRRAVSVEVQQREPDAAQVERGQVAHEAGRAADGFDGRALREVVLLEGRRAEGRLRQEQTDQTHAQVVDVGKASEQVRDHIGLRQHAKRENIHRPCFRSVLEKLGEGDTGSSGSRKRKASTDAAGASAEKSKKSGVEKKKDKKSAADRREELLKQLKAVENAIAKKRTK